MNILPVSEKMKKELAKYFNKETNRYDIGAILNDMPEPEFGNYDHIYAGTDIDDQVVKHDFLSAAHQLNEELESTPETVAVDHDSETEITIKTINENNVEEKIKTGDVITVKPHSTYQHLVQNAVVTPAIEHKHNGYKNAVVIGLYDDGVGGTSVEVEFPSGRIDNVPLEYCQKHADQ